MRAVETVFGWSVQGPIEGTSQQNQCSAETVALRTSVVKDKTADVLSKFWTFVPGKRHCLKAPSLSVGSHQTFTIVAGILEEVFTALKQKVSTMQPEEKNACLLMDEMQISPGLDNDVSSTGAVIDDISVKNAWSLCFLA